MSKIKINSCDVEEKDLAAKLDAELKDAEIQKNLDTISNALTVLDETIKDLRKQNESIKQLLDAKQAELDRLMLEHCPDEMTEEQLKAWGEAQAKAPEEAIHDLGTAVGIWCHRKN